MPPEQDYEFKPGNILKSSGWQPWEPNIGSVKIELIHEHAKVPQKATVESAGYDLYAPEDVVLLPFKVTLVPLGFKVSMADFLLTMEIRPRSGLFLQEQLFVHPGTVDSDYHEEVSVMLYRMAWTRYKIHRGDRIAQAVFAQNTAIRFDVVESLPTSTRGGFGSTGR